MNPESGEPEETELVGDGLELYLRSNLFGALPDRAEWMGLDLSVIPTGETPLPASVDARGELAMLEAVNGDVEELGREQVRGVPTTRYRGEIESAERGELLREEGAEELASQIEAGSPVFDLGIEPEIDLPEPDEVFDMTAIVQKELGLSD